MRSGVPTTQQRNCIIISFIAIIITLILIIPNSQDNNREGFLQGLKDAISMFKTMNSMRRKMKNVYESAKSKMKALKDEFMSII